MWQVEDIIRACQLDIDLIEKKIISHHNVDEKTRAQIKDWWESLIEMMKLEHVKEKGHLQINKNVIIRLTDLHLQLLESKRFPDYTADYYRTLPYIVELRAKQPENEKAGELETCFNALYGVLLLKLAGKEVSHDTLVAIAQISHFTGLLAAYFKKDEESPLFDNDLA